MFDPSQHIEPYSSYVRSGANYDNHTADLGYCLPQIVFEELQPILRKGWRILDVGCGSGLSAERFRGPDLELVGLDGSQELLTLAREKHLYSHLDHVVVGKDRFPHTNHDFNISMALSVMAHFPSASLLPRLLQGAVCNKGLIVFNYLDLEDYSDLEFTTDDSGGTIESSDKNFGEVPGYYHRRTEIEAALEELCVHEHYILPAYGYMGIFRSPTRIVVGQYMPKDS
ncbi:MAG: methyltransferase domain-containing protein [Patescibacteria group bacterium]